jgi:hypothetical protein
MSKSILRDKAKEFAKEVVFVCKDIKTEHKETVLTNQLSSVIGTNSKIFNEKTQSLFVD